ncbi:hypothetical protein BKA65DRAFT_559979 [Rhexocercosporidium sp. MPI-PUGE-AT-0058]|nr:hypothetical protein BKA65DRAFT_559979 [Rhexocercosporidium sp. MPI-PUGE-AT-0058]
MLFTKTAVVLAILDLAAATTCTVAGAKSWPANNDFGTNFGGNGGGGGGDIYGGAQSVADCAAFCKQDQACVTGCLDLIMAGQCNSVGGSACDGGTDIVTNSDNPSDGLIKLRKRNTFNKRATLTCVSSETCYQYTDDSLLCVDMTDGSYHDDIGGNGSLKDGTYTSPSGAVQTGTGTQADVATTAATTTRRSGTAIGNSPAEVTGTATAAAGTNTRTTSTRTTASSNIASQTSAAAAVATSSNAAEMLRAGGVAIGAFGFAVGLVL